MKGRLLDAIPLNSLTGVGAAQSWYVKGAAASVGLLWVQQQAKAMELLEEPNWQSLERQLIEYHLTIERHLQLLADYVNEHADD